MVDIGLYTGYLLFFAGLFIAVVLPLVEAIKNPKNLVKSGMTFGVLLVLFIVAYALSGSELTEKYIAQGVSQEGTSKFIGAGLIMFYMLFLIALVGIIFSEIKKALT